VQRWPTLPDGRIDARSLTRLQLAEVLGEVDGRPERAGRVFQWIWQQDIAAFSEMTNIAAATRRRLDGVLGIEPLRSAGVLDSSDGTRKYLWLLPDGRTIESVLIPDLDRTTPDGRPAPDRLTLCVSSQVGCAMKCSFCLTGDMGLLRNLTPAEIASQPLQVQRSLPDGMRITNIVMMGMGEPLHNYDRLTAALRIMMDDLGLNLSHRRITVSTVGLIPAMKKLADELPVNLAISLNATTEAQRTAVMPLTKRYSLAALMETCATLPLPPGKRIAFEYVMMAGFNASMADADRLVALMTPIADRVKVNLIPYNENPDRDITRPDDVRVHDFQHHLVSRGIHCSVRTTRGRDISAACGQLGRGAAPVTSPIPPQWIPPASRVGLTP
jgi:23S rRNA (adenine2503-C2)-methyltransferase